MAASPPQVLVLFPHGAHWADHLIEKALAVSSYEKYNPRKFCMERGKNAMFSTLKVKVISSFWKQKQANKFHYLIATIFKKNRITFRHRASMEIFSATDGSLRKPDIWYKRVTDESSFSPLPQADLSSPLMQGCRTRFLWWTPSNILPSCIQPESNKTGGHTAQQKNISFAEIAAHWCLLHLVRNCMKSAQC